jgi:hypothetical protein
MLRTMRGGTLIALLGGACGVAQQPPNLRAHPVPVPSASAASAGSNEGLAPSAQSVKDAQSGVSFDLPAGWNLARRDAELSTLRLDARSAPRGVELRAVATLAFNPYPLSTFSGALFYLSVIPHSTAAQCAAQANSRPETGLSPVPVGDVLFARGHDEYGSICTESRDTVYTALHRGSCIRFDLTIHNFCGGEVSGARDMTASQLGAIQQRLEGILGTVRFTGQ